MRATVLEDKSLTRHAGRFVWLSIDTEELKNAAFLDKYPFEAVPTFEVIDAKTEKVAYTWIGAVDVVELVRRFDEAESAFHRTDATAAALPSSPDAGVTALAMAGKNDECAQSALALLPNLPQGAAKASVAASGLDCALSAKEDAPWRAAAVTTLEAAVREALGYEGLLDDDMSGLYGTLVDARDRQKDEAGGKAAAVAWLDWLDAQAKSAPSPEARAALDGYRVSAAQRAESPERVLAAIQQSERELPNDYNPPARLATVLRLLGRYDDAIAASDRALAKVYGPRTITVLDSRATIFEKKGDPEAAKAALRKAIAFAETLPPSDRTKRTIARIEKRLGQVGVAD
jgi:tetratricopeptide (TPR) repeat protein